MLKKIFRKLNIKESDYLVIGCSAGPDSMALLHYIQNNTQNKIVVAHINHNLRKESKEEEKYIEEYCKNNNIIFEKISIQINKNKNIENEARLKRYDFYNQILKKYNTNYLFLAHHGDDLIETILMKIERGSNIEGYAGIKEISYPTLFHNYYIIRPFLSLTKKDLIEYNEKHNIKYYVDKSNYDMHYKRNRYRKNILPLLKEENINIHKQYLKYSKTLLEYNEYIQYEINKYLKELWHNNYLDITNYKSLHSLIQKQLLYRILNDYYNNRPNIIKDNHIDCIIKLICNSKPNLTYNLPNNVIVKKEYNKLYISNYKQIDYINYKEEFKDNFTIDNIEIKKVLSCDTDGNDICRLNSKNITLPLYIRNRKEKYTIILKGLNKHKKIKEIFIEAKLPKEKRNTYPILTDAKDNILWIPNIKKSKFNIQKDQFYDIIIKYCEREDYDEK